MSGAGPPVIPGTFPSLATGKDLAAEKKAREAAVRATIMERLIESGEKERLMELLRSRLVECGWRDEVKAYTKDLIKNRGIQKLTVEQLVAEVTPRARATVPEKVKTELIQNIKTFLQQT
jgi:enhancer of yellow 2 transcription factor